MNTAKAAKGMGRKPATIGQYGTQDAIWQAVRELKSFTVADLIRHIDKSLTVNDYTVKSYLKRLEKGGYLQLDKTPKHRGACVEATYTLLKDTGVETPRLTKEGRPTIQGQGREQLWRSMKILGEFDFFELALAASTEACPVPQSTAKDYCKHLAKAGYLVTTRKGKGTIRARYRLLSSKNTGPRPPQVQRVKRVYDPNLNKVVWQENEGGAK